MNRIVERTQRTHARTKMLLPRHFVHKTNLLLRRLVGSAVPIKDVGRLARVEILDGLVVEFLKDLGRGGLIDIVPVHVFGRFRSRVEDNEAILGRAARVFARVDGKGVAVLGLGHDPFLVGDFVIKELLVGQVAVNGAGSGDSERVSNAHFGAGVRALDRGAALVGIASGAVKIFFCGGR